MTSQISLCRIANIRIKFSIIGTEPLWTTWKWNLDPYLIPVPSTQFDCTIALGGKAFFAQQEVTDSLFQLYNMQSGFFQKQIHYTQSKDTIWSYIRSKNKMAYLQFEVSSDWRKIVLLRDSTNTAGQVAFEYLSQIMPGVFLKHNLLTFHSALVEYQGQAFAVCAPSGTGKTTHARLWRDSKNALILNGDRAVVGKSGAGWTAYGTPWSGTSGEQINRHAPLKALVVLERAPQNSVERLQGLSAFGSVLPHLLYPAWDKPLAVTAIDGLNDLLETVPVYRLRCRPDAGAVDVLCRALYEG